MEVAERVGASRYLTWASHGMARVLLAQEGVAAAERIRALLDRAETLTETHGNRLDLPDVMLTRARPYMIQQVERELA